MHKTQLGSKKMSERIKAAEQQNTYEQKLLPMNTPLDALRVSFWSGICCG
jgi:hypothetical protein